MFFCVLVYRSLGAIGMSMIFDGGVFTYCVDVEKARIIILKRLKLSSIISFLNYFSVKSLMSVTS